MTTQHTPTPWKLSPLPRRSNFEERGTRFAIAVPGKPYLAVLGSCQPDDADFIVTACNAHDELVAALTEARDDLNDSLMGPQAQRLAALAVLNAALAKCAP